MLETWTMKGMTTKLWPALAVLVLAWPAPAAAQQRPTDAGWDTAEARELVARAVERRSRRWRTRRFASTAPVQTAPSSSCWNRRRARHRSRCAWTR
jgi:hypothetical protein